MNERMNGTHYKPDLKCIYTYVLNQAQCNYFLKKHEKCPNLPRFYYTIKMFLARLIGASPPGNPPPYSSVTRARTHTTHKIHNDRKMKK